MQRAWWLGRGCSAARRCRGRHTHGALGSRCTELLNILHTGAATGKVTGEAQPAAMHLNRLLSQAPSTPPVALPPRRACPAATTKGGCTSVPFVCSNAGKLPGTVPGGACCLHKTRLGRLTHTGSQRRGRSQAFAPPQLQGVGRQARTRSVYSCKIVRAPAIAPNACATAANACVCHCSQRERAPLHPMRASAVAANAAVCLAACRGLCSGGRWWRRAGNPPMLR